MKHEKAFSFGGFYTSLLEANLMLHKQVAESGAVVLGSYLKDRRLKKVSVLDLACGGQPVSVAAMMAAHRDTSFDYTGIDINPDQVKTLTESFKFSGNVRVLKVIEGNAWEIDDLLCGSQFDVIFTGMNIHHGTREEISCLLLQIKSLLSAGGIFLNHDFYRSETEPYIRRPDSNPENPEESFLLISSEYLHKYETDARFRKVSQHLAAGDGGLAGSESDWRLLFVDKYRRALNSFEADQRGVEQIMSHVLCRDYPLSLSEMKSIMNAAGFVFERIPLTSEKEPMHGHFCMVSGRPE